jgi:hypothetical protein
MACIYNLDPTLANYNSFPAVISSSLCWGI